MTVNRMLAEMSSPEFTEWMALARIEPIGVERADFQAGISPDFWDKETSEIESTNEKPQSVQDMQARILLASGGLINGNTCEPIS